MSYVYVLDFGDRVKVGYTASPKQRFMQLQYQMRRKAIQTFFTPGALGAEQEAHKRLTPFRIEKEWYHCSFEHAKKIVTEIAAQVKYVPDGNDNVSIKFTMKDNLPRYTLRINQILLEKLEYIARYNGRSKNKEIEMLIRQHIREFERENGKIELEDAE